MVTCAYDVVADDELHELGEPLRGEQVPPGSPNDLAWGLSPDGFNSRVEPARQFFGFSGRGR